MTGLPSGLLRPGSDREHNLFRADVAESEFRAEWHAVLLCGLSETDRQIPGLAEIPNPDIVAYDVLAVLDQVLELAPFSIRSIRIGQQGINMTRLAFAFHVGLPDQQENLDLFPGVCYLLAIVANAVFVCIRHAR